MYALNILFLMFGNYLVAVSASAPLPIEFRQGITTEQLIFLEESYQNHASIVGSQLTITYNVTFDSNDEPVLDPTSGAATEVVTISPGGRICETSDGSPFTSHAYQALQDLLEVIRKDNNRLCCQTNWFGSLCTQMKDHGTAALGICGTRSACMKCQEVFWLLSDLANDCRWHDKVGGIWRIGGWIDFIIYHT
ncbi:hypothetical protein L873DRAFT_1823619 [Choiromyces venosus 120613-1]|uniref:Uncharacterized protein n=1 Tax=Choiromyces venosus 120613-1 TaxID=1336337 RepID=A0A3N4IS86_9PEZI|nr:hypothetical protein L873DRAFT_1823619 [Choiromyces venosus 120613-1]